MGKRVNSHFVKIMSVVGTPTPNFGVEVALSLNLITGIIFISEGKSAIWSFLKILLSITTSIASSHYIPKLFAVSSSVARLLPSESQLH